MALNLAPILLFVYNRPDHAARLVESLMSCELSKESELFIFADAPKIDANIEDIAKNTAVIEFVNSISHFKKVTVYKNETNKGVDKSIMDGVSKIINLYGKVIVLEDDLIVGSFFLKYMNWGLNSYFNDKRIYSVNGFMFPIEYNGDKDVVLLTYSCAWGWATWKDRWESFKYEEESRGVISSSNYLQKQFNLPGIDYANMLIHHRECWDINWYYYIFKNNGLNVFPTKSLIKNSGFDGTGVHCTNIDFFQKFDPTIELKLTVEIRKDLDFIKIYFDYFEKESVQSLKSKLSKVLNKLLK